MRLRVTVATTAVSVLALSSASSFAAGPARPRQLAGGAVQTQVFAFQNMYRWGGWQFTGVWKNGRHRFVGTATGAPSQQWDEGQAVLYPFSIQSTSGRGSLTGSCAGSFSPAGEVARGVLTCTVSVNGSDAVTEDLRVRMVSNASSTDANGGRYVDYYGEYANR